MMKKENWVSTYSTCGGAKGERTLGLKRTIFHVTSWNFPLAHNDPFFFFFSLQLLYLIGFLYF